MKPRKSVRYNLDSRYGTNRRPALLVVASYKSKQTNKLIKSLDSVIVIPASATTANNNNN